jgi:hypothetical protein
MFAVHGNLSPTGCLIMGLVLIVCSLGGITGIILQPSFLTRRWHPRSGRGRGGVPISRLAGFAWCAYFGMFGLASILDGYLKIVPRQTMCYLLLAELALVVLAALHDYLRFFSGRSE